MLWLWRDFILIFFTTEDWFSMITKISYILHEMLHTANFELNFLTLKIAFKSEIALKLKSKIAYSRNESMAYVLLFSTKRRKRKLKIKTSTDPQSKRIEDLTSWSITYHPILEITIICNEISFLDLLHNTTKFIFKNL